MIIHMIHVLSSIVFVCFIKNYQDEISLLKNIGCGQMVVLVNLNQRAHSYGCLAFIETWMFATHGDFLKQDMEKENMMVLGPV